MKKLILIFIAPLVLASCTKKNNAEAELLPKKDITLTDSGDIKIYAPVAQNIWTYDKNPMEYSPVNLFDGDGTTTFEVALEQINLDDYLLKIHFAEPAVFDKLTIKTGHSDKKVNKFNGRPKELTAEIWNCRNKDYEQKVLLADKRIEQTLYEGEKIVATEIRLKMSSVYKGKLKNIKISDLLFYRNGNPLTVSFGKGKCIFGEDLRWYKYDDQERLIEFSYQAGHAGGGTKVYKYEDGKIFAQSISWDDDPDFEPEFVEVKSTEDFGRKTEVLYNDGKKVAEKYSQKERDFLRKYDYDSYYINQFLYDEKGRIRCAMRVCQNSNWSNDYTEYIYNEKNQLIEKIGYEDATIYNERYEE